MASLLIARADPKISERGGMAYHSPNRLGAWGPPRPPEALGLYMLSGA